MTITFSHVGLVVVLIGVATLLQPATARSAETAFKPFLSVSEEVTDNIFELATNKRTEYTTRVRPGATYTYKSPLWTWDTSYTFEYRNYARNSKNNEYNHDGSLKGNISLIDNFLYLDISDIYHRVTLDVTRNAATESSLFINQTDQNVATVSPYLVWRLRGDNTLKTGYRFTDTRYWDPTGIDKREHRGFLDLTHDVTTRFNISTGYAFNRLESKSSRYNKHDANVGFRYEYADKSFLFGQVGNSWQQFENSVNVNYLFWNAGLTHDFRVVVATLETRSFNTEDPLAVSTRENSYSGKLEKVMDRGMLGLSASYSEYINTETDLLDQRKLGCSVTGRYDVFQDLTTSFTVTAEKFSKQTIADYPYRFSGVAGLSYVLKNELTLGLTYKYVINLSKLESSAGAKEINNVVLEVKKVF